MLSPFLSLQAAAPSKRGRGADAGTAPAHVYVLTRGPLEQQLLAGARHRCLAPDLPPDLTQLLQQVRPD